MRNAITYIVWFAGCFMLLMSCGKPAPYRLEGDLASLPDSTLYLVYESSDGNAVDTVTSLQGKFKAERSDGEYYAVTVFYNGQSRWITAYPEKGKKIRITGDARYPDRADIKGGRINDEITAFKKSVEKLLQEKYDILDRTKKETKNNLEEDEVPSRLANIRLQLSEAAVKYIQEHPSEEASAVLIRNYLMDPEDTRKMDEMLAVLSSNIKNSPIVDELEAFSEKAKRTAPGAEAPDFSVENIYGKTLSLKDFDKQYLLLSFAAPWCERCKTDNEYLKEIRRSFPDAKLGMLTVTLDMNQAEVRETIRQDSISWNLVSDSAGYASLLIDLYGVNAIPKNFLIDDTGKIVLNTENSKEIQETLTDLIAGEEG